jgi:hypothetical protein
MGERQRGEGKPETLLAGNAKLASNIGAHATPSSDSLTKSTSTASSNGLTTSGLATSGEAQTPSSNATPSAAAASSIARTTTGSSATRGKGGIAHSSSDNDVWNGTPTTMVTATSSHANKLALNTPTATARPTDAALSN